MAPSAYLASAAGSKPLVKNILRHEVDTLHFEDDALRCWTTDPGLTVPTTTTYRQKDWDVPKVKLVQKSLIENTPDEISRARLLSTTCHETGAWLTALPISQLGLRLDNESVRIAVALRLGIPICEPHRCVRCGAQVSKDGHHPLSCPRSISRHSRHSTMNDIISRALSAAHVQSRLEPVNLFRSDGKRPDGATLVPWEFGRILVWDATCPDTYAQSYRNLASQRAGAVADQAEEKKLRKYQSIPRSYNFTPVAIETSGVFGEYARYLFNQLGRRIKRATGESKSHHFLLQRISIAVQVSNSAAIAGSMGSNPSLFY